MSAECRQLLERMGPAGTQKGTIAAARVHLLLGDLEAATALRAHAAPAVHVRGRVTIAVLDALLAAAAGHEHRATDHLENALATAAPWSLRRPFLVEAGVLRPLLERRIETGTAVPGFALELLERTSDESGADTEPGARSSTRSPNVNGPCCATWPARCRMRRSPPSCTCR